MLLELHHRTHTRNHFCDRPLGRTPWKSKGHENHLRMWASSGRSFNCSPIFEWYLVYDKACVLRMDTKKTSATMKLKLFAHNISTILGLFVSKIGWDYVINLREREALDWPLFFSFFISILIMKLELTNWVICIANEI